VKKLQLTAGLVLLLATVSAHASILWVGGEDIDFPNGAAGVVVDTTAGRFRSGYARSDIRSGNTTSAYSNPFPGGGVTSGWLTVRAEMNCSGAVDGLQFGLIQYSMAQKGLWIGTGAGCQVALYKYDGSTKTKLATASNSPWVGNAVVLARFDLQVVNYGTSATVNVFVNTTPVISYTGDITVSGVSNFDAVALGAGSVGNSIGYSEIIVANSDTRTMGLATLTPNAAGDINNWTGDYTQVSESAINDATLITDSNAGDNFECKMNSLPSGTFWIPMVVVKARAVKGVSGLGSLSVGVKTNGTIIAPAPTAQQPYWSVTESYSQTNPVTSASWTQDDINALQINLQSGN